MRDHAYRQLECINIDVQVRTLLRHDPAGRPLRANDDECERSLLAAPVTESSRQTSSRRILEMVAVLHRMGYERLRAITAIAPTGLHWRCMIAPADEGHTVETARYTSGQEPTPYDWEDSADDTPEQLAKKFIERFADLAAAGKGRDEPYARWFAEMMAMTATNGLIYAGADYDMPEGYLPAAYQGEWRVKEVRVPLPPVGG
jgi:hypothetical protein